MMRHSFLIIIIATLAAAVLGGCSSSRRAVSSVGASDRVDTAWQTLYAPVKVSLREPMAFSASGRATMVRDSLIHLSLRVFGMEVAQLRATADSAWLVDRYHKMYTSVPLRSVLGSRGLTLGAAQDLLLGQASLEEILPAAAELVTVIASEFQSSPAGQVAEVVDIAATVRGRKIAASLRWDLDKARWNGYVDTEWSIPSGARRIEPDDLLSSLKNL